MDRYGDKDWSQGDRHDVHIRQLQRDLHKLGFSVVGRVDGFFGRRTFWALREFQIHASWPTTGHLVSGSRPRHERLTATDAGGNVYGGQISGIANAQTRALLATWLDNNWHSPVIVNAWRINEAGTKTALVKENVWLHDDHPVSTSSIGYFAHDVSGRFAGLSSEADGSVLIGRYVRYSTYGGQRNTPPKFTDETAEITPERLTGRKFSELPSSAKASFRVIRAVSEVECLGFFDCLNAYDNAIVSLGPCHWTLGIITRTSTGSQVSYGELCGTLSYFEYAHPSAAKSLLRDFGVTMTHEWADAGGKPSGALLFNTSQKKYVSWPAFPNEQGYYWPVPLVEADANYFKSWHWIYRWVAAGRVNQGLRKTIWDMSRVRLRDLTALELTVNGKRTTVGKIFTSEKALAILLRWHIRYPANIASGSAGVYVRRIVNDALSSSVPGGWPSNPKDWTDRHERELIESARTFAKGRSNEFWRTIDYVDNWPSWKNGPNPRQYQLNEGTSPLSERRNSFELYTHGLPPRPWQETGSFAIV